MRLRSQPGKLPAAILALLVHLAFLALLVFSVSWQNRPPEAVQVDLWRSLPEPAPVPAPPPPPPPPPQEARPEPVEEAKPQPQKSEISLKAKKEEQRKREEKLKQEKQKRLEEQRRQAETEKAQEEKRRRERRLREEAAQRVQDEQRDLEQVRQAQAAAAAKAKVADDYKSRINARIKSFINNQPCLPLPNPEVEFDVTLMPTGHLLNDPRLRKSSGNASCDQAIERAILRAQPLPLPLDPGLFSQFRELHLKFRPREEN